MKNICRGAFTSYLTDILRQDNQETEQNTNNKTFSKSPESTPIAIILKVINKSSYMFLSEDNFLE